MLSAKLIDRLAILGVTLCWLGVFFFDLSLIFLLALVLFWLTLTIIGSFHIRWNFHVPSLHSAKTDKKGLISLTFDDGPHPEFTPRILEVLDTYEAKATFFCIGREMEKYPEVVKEILKRGHSIGNHSYTHSKRIGWCSAEEICEEIQRTNDIAEQISQKKLKMYRPPFGVTNPSIAAALRSTEMISIGWSIRSLDTTKRTQEQILNRVKSRAKEGEVILLHDNRAGSPELVEQLLLFLRDKGLRSVKVEEILDIRPYE
jgi:peptidoglycan/xylan/chitin deacetylase (PgdA/CDA1 family)